MFKVGDKVKFNAHGGSVGQVVAEKPYRGYLAVEWVYGRDVRGEVMTGLSASVAVGELISATEDEYAAIRDREGFGEGRAK